MCSHVYLFIIESFSSSIWSHRPHIMKWLKNEPHFNVNRCFVYNDKAGTLCTDDQEFYCLACGRIKHLFVMIISARLSNQPTARLSPQSAVSRCLLTITILFSVVVSSSVTYKYQHFAFVRPIGFNYNVLGFIGLLLASYLIVLNATACLTINYNFDVI